MRVGRTLATAVAGSALFYLTFSTASALPIEIVGGGTPPFPQYGNSSGNNNVLGPASANPTSKVTDPFAPASPGSSFIGTNDASMARVETTLTNYKADWWFVGAESGYNNTLTVTNPLNGWSGSHTEFNQNSNCCSPGAQNGAGQGPLFLGTSQGNAAGAISFNVKDNQGGIGVTNGVNNSKPSTSTRPSLVFSYIIPTSFTLSGDPLAWELSKLVTQWVLFAYNDTGGPDDDHDDYIGIMRAYGPDPGNPTVPVPGAFALMGTILAGAGGVTAWRRRRAKAVA